MKVLLIEAHPDDVTISCGGTIARMKREHPDWEFILTYFCPCTEDSVNDGNLEEHQKVCDYLGINHVIPYYFLRDGYLETHKQEVRDILYTIREDWHPELVLCPSIHEFHQDHKTVADCCLTIFRDTSTILGYEVLRSSTPDFKPNLFVILTCDDVLRKVEVINIYKSQLETRPYFFTENIFVSHMTMRGTQAKTQWAEAFEVMWGRI